MRIYEPSVPRALPAVAAVAMAVVTFVAMVAFPATVEAVRPEAARAASQMAAPAGAPCPTSRTTAT